MPDASPARPPARHWLRESIVAKLLAYYGALFFAGYASQTYLPDAIATRISAMIAPMISVAPADGSVFPTSRSGSLGGAVTSGHDIALLALFVCTVSILLAMPMAWTYMHTRKAKGYQQSVVHTIVLMPAIVAAISVLVRNNFALAFALAGIVAAVRFRTNLEDSKDAVFIFAVSALGLACGVHIEFAAVLSFMFSALALALWYSDFGRTPPALEGQRADESMQRALAIANRTSQFVARIDREVLGGMAPAQLEALATRVRKRRSEVLGDDGPDSFDGELMLEISDLEAGQRVLEAVLKERTKRFALLRSEDKDGTTALAYGIKLRRGVRLNELAVIVERECNPFVASVFIDTHGEQP